MNETGALTPEEIDALLAQEPEPGDNKPMRVPHHAGVGNSPTVAREEQTRRRRVMAAMLANGFGVDEIVEQFGKLEIAGANGPEPGFAMTQSATMMLLQQVLNAWQEEDAILGPHAKRLAIRRTLATIRTAKAKGHYTAVATLEANLMKLQGTAAPVRVEAELRVTGAILGVLGEMTEEDLRELIAGEVSASGERRIAHRSDPPMLPPGVTRVTPPR